MRNHALLLAGLCFLAPGLAGAQTAPKQAPPAAERKEIKVPVKTLQTLVGGYDMTDGRILTITLEDGSLFGQPTDQAKRQLFAESPTKFFLKDLPVVVTFNKDAKGKVIGMTMEQRDRPTRELKKLR